MKSARRYTYPMSGFPKEKTAGPRVTIRGGISCESRRDETVLSALARGGAALSAPCGGRGICGKCRVTLVEGKVRVAGAAGPDAYPKPGDSFAACKGTAISDITVELAEGENGAAPELPRGAKGTRTGGKKIRRAGIGLDIGTTTVQAELIDLDTGESLETLSALNAQRSFGADVMSRINAARGGKTGELFTALNRQIEDILRHFIREWNLSGIEQCGVSGNTTMLHLFSGADPSGMGEVPFTPEFLEERHFSGKELSLSAERVTLLPGISAFVGGDVVSGLAFLDMLDRKEDCLFVDIGTNGEMALWRHAEKRLLCCSTAAGPCFEGAEISSGMGALPGAINRIHAAGTEPAPVGAFTFGPLVFTTLGNLPPRGICGAALIDAIAVMKRLAAVDETGALAEGYAETGFPIAKGIVVSQKDIRQFQLAKSAIRSGIDVLCKKAGLKSPAELGAVYIAGGLGFFIDPENAVTSGLFPPEFAEAPDETEPRGRIIVCGNTSLKGAAQSLIDPGFLPRCRKIAAQSETVELAADSDFIEAFTENMYF